MYKYKHENEAYEHRFNTVLKTLFFSSIAVSIVKVGDGKDWVTGWQ